MQDGLIGDRRYFVIDGELPLQSKDFPEIDPRWVELAIELDLPKIVYANPIVGHRPMQDFLTKQWNQLATKKKSHEAIVVALSMLQCQHPEGANLIMAKVAEMVKQKSGFEVLQWCQLVSNLQASSLPQLEALYADDKTPTALSKTLLDSIQTIRDRANSAQADQ